MIEHNVPGKIVMIAPELIVNKSDRTPSADSVAIVVYALRTRMADGMAGETVVVVDGMMRNIVKYQPAIIVFICFLLA